MKMVRKPLVKAGWVLAVWVLVFFCVLPAANALWVGGNIDVHNNTNMNAHDFHIKGKIKSTTLPTLFMQIGYVDGIPFPNFSHTITPAGGDLWDFEAKWWSLDVKPSQVGHFGLFFNATCRNVWVDLDGWWTDREGNPIGKWPIPGFEVPTHWWDPPSEQVFRLQGDAGKEGINTRILQMDLMLIAPPANPEDLFRRLNVNDMDSIGRWSPVKEAVGRELPAGSFFDVFMEPVLGRGMKPNELLLARTRVVWPAEPDGRWFFHVHQAHGFGSIHGHVTDVAGKPLRAFVIAINAETKERAWDITDADGYYEIPDLAPGIYWMLCIKRDYKPGIKKAEVVADEQTPVDFMLNPKTE